MFQYTTITAALQVENARPCQISCGAVVGLEGQITASVARPVGTESARSKACTAPCQIRPDSILGRPRAGVSRWESAGTVRRGPLGDHEHLPRVGRRPQEE